MSDQNITTAAPAAQPPVDRFANRWRFLTKEAATTPPKGGYVQIVRDAWWVVCPERGLAFFHTKGQRGLGAAQCNSNEAISRRLGTTIPGGVIEQIPLVFVPIDISDYHD